MTPRVNLRALFLPESCNQEDVAALTATTRWRICSTWHGDIEILSNPRPAMHLQHGAGIVLYIPPLLPRLPDAPPPVEDFTWLMQAQRPVRHDGGGDHAMNDHLRQLRNPQPPHELNLAVIYRQNVRPRRIYIRMGSFEDVIGHIAALLHIDIEDIVNAYELRAPVQGEVESAYTLILRQLDDRPPGSPGQLHLFDIEYHGHDSAAFPPLVTRRVYSASLHLARTHILHLAQVEQFCRLNDDRCLVFHKNEIWPLQDRKLRTLQSGQYFRAAAPPSSNHIPQPRVCVESASVDEGFF